MGGGAKSRVFAEVMGGRVIVQTAEDFATVAAKVVPGVNVIPLMQDEIDKVQIDWNQAKDVPGIMKAHVISCAGHHINMCCSVQSLNTPIQQVCYQGDVCCGCESSGIQNAEQSFSSSCEMELSSSITPGIFLLVKVYGKRSWKPYVAQVSVIDKSDINVTFLKKQTECNFIYQDNDTASIHADDILKKLPTPIINNRGIVVFPHTVMC